jgi:hypothetical protein
LREDFFFADDFLADDFLADDVADDFRPDFRERPLLVVSPASRRCLFTVAAAIRLAVALLRPRFFAEDLIFSY